MRISIQEIKAIKQSFKKAFKTGAIFLFGSRTNDKIKGGYIDLYLILYSKNNLREKKIHFLVDLKSKIGDQKIDVVIARDYTRLIEQEALKNGILL